MSDIKRPSLTGTSDPGADAEFDALLRDEGSRLAALYSKLPGPEPDASIDARVRAQARSALRTAPGAAVRPATRRPTGSRARRWLPAFGAAATLVLVAGLAWRLLPPAASTRGSAAIADKPAAVVAQGERSAPMPAPASPPAQPAASPTLGDPAARSADKVRSTAAAKPESAAAADKAKADAKSTLNGALATEPKVAAPTSATPPSGAEAAAFPPRAVEPARGKNAPPATAAAPSPPPPLAAVEAQAARSAAVAASPPESREAADADRSAPTQAFADSALAREPSFVIRSDPIAPAHYRWEIAGGTAPARGGVYPPDPPPPAAWVQIVRAMLRDGHRDAARRALVELRVRHPDFPVPPDLQLLE